ncbi:kinase-like domain-containing protein [Syncephalastrum racemosum]|uniref:Kinase-like domain-containing protein n=1 Tax=Syncephalastrum racemosum TaxID=13706 RepID=A0A1X2H3V3_SYNRA|nr:kinase-like domain-containing protein [Syncephalastrum racemosum]
MVSKAQFGSSQPMARPIPQSLEQHDAASSLLATSVSSTRSDLSEDSRHVILADRWLVNAKIGEGSFGEVFEAQDIITRELYAIKREVAATRHPRLEHEKNMYDLLAGGPGVPQTQWYGTHEDFNILVMDLLGPSLKELRQCISSMSLEIAIDLGCQMLDILEHIHQMGLVFRDMKPDNFLFPATCLLPEVETFAEEGGMAHFKYNAPTCQALFEQWRELQCEPRLSVVDFGLTTHWRDPKTGEPYEEGKRRMKNKIGTARYASLNVHRGRTHAPRDDLEGLAYLLLDMILGTLPWAGIQARNSKAGWDRMRAIKEETFISDLCAGRPQGIVDFVEYTRSLRFTQNPDYERMRHMLQGSLPGGDYSQPARSPFGGTTQSQDTQSRAESDQDPIPASQQHLRWQMRSKEKKVGWYTYKREQAPWEPETDWKNIETPAEATLSWGDTIPDAGWGKTDGSERGWAAPNEGWIATNEEWPQDTQEQEHQKDTRTDQQTTPSTWQTFASREVKRQPQQQLAENWRRSAHVISPTSTPADSSTVTATAANTSAGWVTKEDGDGWVLKGSKKNTQPTRHGQRRGRGRGGRA